MDIRQEIYEKIILNVPMSPPEKGGILGEKNGTIVAVKFDEGIKNEAPCCYSPNVDYLNKVIAGWTNEEINFAGIFHTHFYGVKTLSNGDERYIKKIHASMPESMDTLFFPIVLPEQQKIVSYISIRKDNEVIIKTDNIEKV